MNSSTSSRGRCLLVFNTGSSSIKAALFHVDENEDPALMMSFRLSERDGAHHFSAIDANGVARRECALGQGTGVQWIKAMLPAFLDELKTYLPSQQSLAIGHRVVHGGTQYSAPTIITPEIRKGLDSLKPLAPLHQAASLEAIDICTENFPSSIQVACFDTAFHRTHPWVSDTYGLPRGLFEEGVRRYGFHGLSYESVMMKLRQIAPEIDQERVIIAHLGNGASMCAIRAGRSMASTMGFTPLDGLPMGTRSGQIDPGVLLYLLEEKGMKASEVRDLLYNRSGLFGLSGLSSHMQELLKSRERRAAEAIEYFIHRVVCGVGELAAELQGVDTMVFTGGIGEHATSVRERVVEKLNWLGLSLDRTANETDEGENRRISSKTSKVAVWVISTDEEKMIAMHTARLLREEHLERR